MKTVNECTLQMWVKRSSNKTMNMAFAYVTETKTLFLVTIKICGYSLPCVENWKISKKEARDASDAALKIAQQAYIQRCI